MYHHDNDQPSTEIVRLSPEVVRVSMDTVHHAEAKLPPMTLHPSGGSDGSGGSQK